MGYCAIMICAKGQISPNVDEKERSIDRLAG
jgi:hypothetical protein